eukprot:Ihof_evm2s309 gene=Ihof_evmTU2s309
MEGRREMEGVVVVNEGPIRVREGWEVFLVGCYNNQPINIFQATQSQQSFSSSSIRTHTNRNKGLGWENLSPSATVFSTPPDYIDNLTNHLTQDPNLLPLEKKQREYNIALRTGIVGATIGECFRINGKIKTANDRMGLVQEQIETLLCEPMRESNAIRRRHFNDQSALSNITNDEDKDKETNSKEVNTLSTNEKTEDHDTAGEPLVENRWGKLQLAVNKARSEVDITMDLLNVLQQQTYMRVELAPRCKARKPDLILKWASKKANLNHAALILDEGANRLARVVDEEADYYMSLQQLQQRWRLTQDSNQGLGGVNVDVSYDTRAWSTREAMATKRTDLLPIIPGEFSVVREEGGVGGELLSIDLPPEFKEIKLLTSEFSPRNTVSTPTNPIFYPPGCGQSETEGCHRQLKIAQNGYYCRDVFNHLCVEAGSCDLPVMICENVIRLTLDPHTQFSVCFGPPSTPTIPPSTIDGRGVHDDVGSHSELSPFWGSAMILVLQMYRRLVYAHITRERYHSRLYSPKLGNMEDEITGRPGVEQRYGPLLLDKEMTMNGSATSSSILSGVYQIAQHVALVGRLCTTLDTLAHLLPTPSLTIHWTPTTSPTSTHCTLEFSLVEPSFDMIGYDGVPLNYLPLSQAADSTWEGATCRKLARLYIRGVSITIVMDDGGVYDLAEDEIAAFTMTQACASVVTILRAKGTAMGWGVLQ